MSSVTISFSHIPAAKLSAGQVVRLSPGAEPVIVNKSLSESDDVIVDFIDNPGDTKRFNANDAIELINDTFDVAIPEGEPDLKDAIFLIKMLNTQGGIIRYHFNDEVAFAPASTQAYLGMNTQINTALKLASVGEFFGEPQLIPVVVRDVTLDDNCYDSLVDAVNDYYTSPHERHEVKLVSMTHIPYQDRPESPRDPLHDVEYTLTTNVSHTLNNNCLDWDVAFRKVAHSRHWKASIAVDLDDKTMPFISHSQASVSLGHRLQRIGQALLNAGPMFSLDNILKQND
jgi:hypothetical protein